MEPCKRVKFAFSYLKIASISSKIQDHYYFDKFYMDFGGFAKERNGGYRTLPKRN